MWRGASRALPRRSAVAAGVGCGVACITTVPAAAADSSGKKKVVVTGASGMIAQLALPALREQYDVVAIDIREGPGVSKYDLLGSREDIRPFFKGAYAIFHAGFVPPPKVKLLWSGPRAFRICATEPSPQLRFLFKLSWVLSGN